MVRERSHQLIDMGASADTSECVILWRGRGQPRETQQHCRESVRASTAQLQRMLDASGVSNDGRMQRSSLDIESACTATTYGKRDSSGSFHAAARLTCAAPAAALMNAIDIVAILPTTCRHATEEA